MVGSVSCSVSSSSDDSHWLPLAGEIVNSCRDSKSDSCACFIYLSIGSKQVRYGSGVGLATSL